MTPLGRPRLHLRQTGSTNSDACHAAARGAPHGTLVTAGAQTAGRGRQGRVWTAPAGQALLLSLVVRRFDRLLALRAGLAVAETVGEHALIKWPNDVIVGNRKIAGALAEAFPADGWAVIGIGVNVAVDLAALPHAVRERAGTLGSSTQDIEPTLDQLLRSLERCLCEAPASVLARLRRRDFLYGRRIGWAAGTGTAAGIDDSGALVVRQAHGGRLALDAGEVHLLPDAQTP